MTDVLMFLGALLIYAGWVGGLLYLLDFLGLLPLFLRKVGKWLQK